MERIVVGLPVHTSGREGQLAGLARKWGSWLASATGLPVVYADERYTSVEADNLMIQSGLKRQKRKDLRDKLAAQILLQGYLDVGCPEVEAPCHAARRPGGSWLLSTLIVGCGYLGCALGLRWFGGVNRYSGPCVLPIGPRRSPVLVSNR